MSVPSVLAPVFVQVLLVGVLLLNLSWRRTIEIRAGRAPMDGPADGRPWSGRTGWAGASYSNQFELPVLFFALVPLALLTHKADLPFVVLEWLFVLCRIAQAAVHVTSNVVAVRGAFFMAGAVALSLAWLLFAVAILAGG